MLSTARGGSSSVPTKAMVLAAGEGKRMRPITNQIPKPMVEVASRPLVERVIDRLEEAGVNSIVVNLHYLGHVIEQRLRQRTSPEILFSPEDELLDTGGGVANALGMLGKERFFVVNSDTLWLNGTQCALTRMAQAWDDKTMDGLLLLSHTVEAYGYTGIGDFCADPAGVVSRRPELEVSPYVFSGVQILHPRLFKKAPKGAFSLNMLYDQAIEEGRLHGIVHDGEWFHVGTAEGLAEAESYMGVRYPGRKHR